jgi:hypothetical protein
MSQTGHHCWAPRAPLSAEAAGGRGFRQTAVAGAAQVRVDADSQINWLAQTVMLNAHSTEVLCAEVGGATDPDRQYHWAPSPLEGIRPCIRWTDDPALAGVFPLLMSAPQGGSAPSAAGASQPASSGPAWPDDF